VEVQQQTASAAIYFFILPLGEDLFFPSLNATIIKLMGMCEDKMKANDFALSPSQEYRGVQKLVSTAFFSTLHGAIIDRLPLEHYKAWLSSRRTTFTSLSLNSSVRHFTHQRPPPA
jgi:hypothetical protein